MNPSGHKVRKVKSQVVVGGCTQMNEGTKNVPVVCVSLRLSPCEPPLNGATIHLAYIASG